MSPENFKSHQVFEKLQQLDSRINEPEAKEKIDLENLLFFQSAYKYISDKLKTTIPILVQEAEINALSSEVDAGLQQINNFLGSANVGYMTNAVNNFNSALNRIRNFPLPFAKSDFDFSKTIANFQQTLQEKYELVETEKDELAKEIEAQKLVCSKKMKRLNAYLNFLKQKKRKSKI